MGVPAKVIRRAKEILALTEAQNPKQREVKEIGSLEDLNITMENVANDEIRDALTALDLNITSPMEAYDFLRKLKALL